MDKDDYNREMGRILSDIETYAPLRSNTTLGYKRELKKMVDSGFRNISSWYHWLLVMYCLPKVHKSLVDLTRRPIISGIDSITARAGKYLDHYLQPLVMGSPSFFKEIKHVINTLREVKWKRISADNRGCCLLVHCFFT